MHQVLLAPELGCGRVPAAGRRASLPPLVFVFPPPGADSVMLARGGVLRKVCPSFSLSLSPPRSVRCARGGEELFTIAPLISNRSDVAVLLLTTDFLFT